MEREAGIKISDRLQNELIISLKQIVHNLKTCQDLHIFMFVHGSGLCVCTLYFHLVCDDVQGH